MYSHHPAPVDTVSFLAKLAMRSIIQTCSEEERKEDERRCRRGREGDNVGGE